MFEYGDVKDLIDILDGTGSEGMTDAQRNGTVGDIVKALKYQSEQDS